MQSSYQSEIHRENAVPLYLQVKDSIRKKILTKEWPGGSRIPGEAELCTLFNVSRITVRKALDELQQEHYLQKQRGKGTFIKGDGSIEQRLSKFYSFSEELRKKGMREYARLIHFSQQPADEEVAGMLRCQPDETVFCIRRIRYTEDKPYVVETSYIPYRLVPSLNGDMIRENGLYHSLNLLGVYPLSATERFHAVNLPEETAAQLEVAENDAAIALMRVTYMAGEIVIEYCQSYVRGDFFRYTVELN